MKRPVRHGPSIYYASDKNIFDALNEHKVDSETVASLFERRNTLVSQKTPRQDLASYFAIQTHDYFDHQEISSRLGVLARPERVTSLDLKGASDEPALLAAIAKVTKGLQQFGDVVTTRRSGSSVLVDVQYSVVDYRRSEFNQVQKKDGFVEFVPATGGGYIVRSTQNEYLNDIRDSLVGELASSAGLERREVSLLAWPEPRTRSKFFFELFSGLDGFSLDDVTDIYAFKPSNVSEDMSEEELDSFVERVSLRGLRVSRSEYLANLARDGYYIVKAGWKSKYLGAIGNIYAIEAVFADPLHCTGFSFIILGVHEYREGVVSKQKRKPEKGEVGEVSRSIERRSRELMEMLRSKGSLD